MLIKWLYKYMFRKKEFKLNNILSIMLIKCKALLKQTMFSFMFICISQPSKTWVECPSDIPINLIEVERVWRPINEILEFDPCFIGWNKWWIQASVLQFISLSYSVCAVSNVKGKRSDISTLPRKKTCTSPSFT